VRRSPVSDKVANVPKLLRKWAGREHELVQRVKAKYAVAQIGDGGAGAGGAAGV